MIQTSLNKKDDLVALKNAVDINYLLTSLGIKVIRDTPKEIRSTCVIHGGDNKSAFRFNKISRTWVCFTHKCHEIHGNDILGLIKGVLNVDFISAVNFLKTLVGDVSYARVVSLESKLNKDKDTFTTTYKNPEKPSYVSEEALSKFKPFRSNYFLDKGFKKETLDFFEIAGGFTDKYGIVRDIIPIRDVKGNLLAYSMRDIRDNADKEYKYLFTTGFSKDKVLYNLNNAWIYGTSMPLILVEGFKSVWRLHECGFYNTVAVMGSMLTSGQLNLLKVYALDGVILFFDPDEAGILGTETTSKMLNRILKCDCVYMNPSLGEDPADLDLKMVYGYLHEYFR